MFRWRREEEGRVQPPVGPGTDAYAAVEQSCPSMARVLKRILGGDGKPEILDLGPLCGPTVTYLAGRGARVSVEEFVPPPPMPPSRTKVPQVAVAERVPVAIAQPDEKFDLVLAWEHCDFTPPERLAEFGAELARVVAPGGWLLLFCRDSSAGKTSSDRPARYRLLADDRLRREAGPGPDRARWAHANREVERALAPLSIQGIHLQRSRVREFLALKV